MIRPPQVFHKLILELYKNQKEAPKFINQIFRGITNIMPGYWTIVGVTHQAYELMNLREWKGEFTRDLRRDHMISARDFQTKLMSNEYTYEEFVELTNEYGKCILCTKEQNPPRQAGFQFTYNENEIYLLPSNKTFDTATEMSVKATHDRAFLFKNLVNS